MAIKFELLPIIRRELVAPAATFFLKWYYYSIQSLTYSQIKAVELVMISISVAMCLSCAVARLSMLIIRLSPSDTANAFIPLMIHVIICSKSKYAMLHAVFCL